ncbi:hypothetical protein C8J57DRAFT_1339486 [Mycena rebaudengoi]|nr:hypothetical protein C8J57DRAFT_1339486 [Mycena rebaudengoi]
MPIPAVRGVASSLRAPPPSPPRSEARLARPLRTTSLQRGSTTRSTAASTSKGTVGARHTQICTRGAAARASRLPHPSARAARSLHPALARARLGQAGRRSRRTGRMVLATGATGTAGMGMVTVTAAAARSASRARPRGTAASARASACIPCTMRRSGTIRRSAWRDAWASASVRRAMRATSRRATRARS